MDYEYSDLLLRSCDKVLYQKDLDNNYQGDYLFIVQKGNKVGVQIQAYGSCSGCDELQACSDEEDYTRLAKEMEEGIAWGDSIADILKNWDKKVWLYHNDAKLILEGLKNEDISKFVCIDGINSIILREKKSYIKVKNIDTGKILYVVDNGERKAHGETLKAAIRALEYKLTNRDTSAYVDWKLTDVKSRAELIQAYHDITGSCEGGIQHWCETRDLPDSCTIEDAIKLTVSSYGGIKFKKFFAERDSRYKEN